MRKNRLILLLSSAVLAAAIVYIYISPFRQEKISGSEIDELTEQADSVMIIEEIAKEYGIPVDSFNIIRGRVSRNQNLSVILSEFNVERSIIHEIANFSRDIFDARRIRAGNQWALFLSRDSLNEPKYFVYEESPVEYITMSLYEPVNIGRNSKEIETVLREGSAVINSSLWNAAVSSDLSPMVAIKLSEIFAWNIDFFGLQRGDYFRAIYEEDYVEDSPVGNQRIKAALFNHMGREFYAIPFEQDSVLRFFDQDGNSLQRAFLKAPLRYSRISSGFSNSRMHPILRVRRPHHGVDYAAPVGTPVYAIGDGRVTETSYSAGAGRMIKIRHNSVYTTAYLHLRNFATGIKPNSWVTQGQVIGYVGSSGLSTGPHLDFRIWKNGTPVNPLRIESPPVEPVKEENLEEFIRIRDMWVERLEMQDRIDRLHAFAE
jgi:murein DD-endopeptidase MepM/ murein hydrolase activator NlpD